MGATAGWETFPQKWATGPPRQNGQMSEAQLIAVAKINLAAGLRAPKLAGRSVNARIVPAPGGVFRRRSSGSLPAWRFDDERQSGPYLLLEKGKGRLFVSNRHVGNGIFADCLELEQYVRLYDPPVTRLEMLLDELKRFSD